LKLYAKFDNKPFDEEELKIKLMTDDFDLIQTRLTNQLNEKTEELRYTKKTNNDLRNEIAKLKQEVFDVRTELRVLLKFLEENKVPF
jgi:archaellum component FlaC